MRGFFFYIVYDYRNLKKEPKKLLIGTTEKGEFT